MKREKSMETIRNELLLQHLSLEEGILPIQLVAEEREAAMASLSPEEQRKAKRKYRKMWRKLARAERKPLHKNRLGYGNLKPSEEHPSAGGVPHDFHRTQRKSVVYLELFTRLLEIVRKIEGNEDSVPIDETY